MNSRQRRTVRRALDAMKPWGRAVARERRKGKRAKRPTREERMRRAYESAGPVDLRAVNAFLRDTKEKFFVFDHAPKLRHEASE